MPAAPGAGGVGGVPYGAADGAADGGGLAAPGAASALAGEIAECRRQITAMRGELAADVKLRTLTAAASEPRLPFCGCSRPTPMQDASNLLLRACAPHGGGGGSGGGSHASVAHAYVGAARLSIEVPLSGFGAAYTPAHDGRSFVPRKAAPRPLWYAASSRATVTPSLHPERERSAAAARRFL
eukprot:5119318-Prymnesium_polylepis.1